KGVHLHCLTRSIEIAIRNNFRMRPSCPRTVITPGEIRCSFGKLQCGPGRGVRDKQMCVPSFGILNFREHRILRELRDAVLISDGAGDFDVLLSYRPYRYALYGTCV